MIKEALSVLPARPILFVVPVIVVLVMSFYYSDVYSRCTSNKQFRASLNENLSSAHAGAQFRLEDITAFAWDRVRIVTDFEPERRSNECPFDWNWPGGDRESLIASGLLTVLIFVHRGAIVEYLELRGDEVAFRGADFSLSPKAAVFSVIPNADDSRGITLTLKN